MAGVTLDTVRKIYAGNVEAVKGVSLGIEDGSFCVLVGPSGCGKSTLLRMIAGLETISGGEVKIGERVVNQVEPADRDIAMVFQNYALYPHMSVYDNMAYGLKNRGTPKDEIEKRVKEAARILAIEPFLARKPRAVVRRPAPARRHGPRHRAQAAGLPLRRAALQPRRQAARADARRDQAPPAGSRRDLDLRHPRSGRGDDALRQARGDVRRPDRAGRLPRRRLSPPRDPVRGHLHRLAAHEHPVRNRGRPGPRVGRRADRSR